MVLGEVGRPIERADIIERDSAALDGAQSQVMASLFDEPEESVQPVAALSDEEVEEALEALIEDQLDRDQEAAELVRLANQVTS